MLGFVALGSTAISAQGGLPNNLAVVLQTTASTNATLFIANNLSADILATNITATVLNVDKLLQSSLDVTANVTPNVTLDHILSESLVATSSVIGLIDVNKQLDQNLSVTANATPNLTLEQQLDQNLIVTGSVTGLIDVNKQLDQNLSVTANVAPNLTLENLSAVSVDVITEVSATLALNKQLEASIQATNTTVTLLDVDRPLASNLSTSITIVASITDLVTASVNVDVNIVGVLSQVIDINCETDVTVNVSGNLDVIIDLFAESVSIINVIPNLQQIIALVGNAVVETDITVGIPVACNVTVETKVYPLLDVDGNTFGSPGGEAAPGFFPPSSVLFANHSESAPEETYTITADFSEDPNIVTEIIEVDFDDNPAEVLAWSIVGNQTFITARTPREVYAESSTFLVKRDLEPLFGTPIDYRVRFNTVVKQSRNGNNFYSNKFTIDTGDTCFLRDDGEGLIALWEENTPGAQFFVKNVGKINYDTGEVEVRQLDIRSKQEPTLFFAVESLNNVIPTSDYFNEKNSTIVQSKTITFPSGEQVEISQYEKSTDIVNIFIYVKARSYNIATPEVTIEEREAIYKFTVLPDYDSGKERLLQLIAEEV